MTRKGIILLTVMMMAAGAVFASGQQDVEESDNDVQGRGYNSEERFKGRFNDGTGEDCLYCGETPEEITMTGNVEFTSTGTKMTVEGEEWLLLYPYRAVNIEIEDGTEITVTGWEVVIPEGAEDRMKGRMDFDENANLFHVVSAEIDGEIYELEFEGPFGRGGNMDGRAGRDGHMDRRSGGSRGNRPGGRDRRG